MIYGLVFVDVTGCQSPHRCTAPLSYVHGGACKYPTVAYAGYLWTDVNILKQICKNSPVAISLYVSVCVCLSVCLCVSVCYFRSRRSFVRENKKMEKMTFVDFDICQRMASLRKLYSQTLTYFFKVKYLIC